MGVATFRRLHERQRALKSSTVAEAEPPNDLVEASAPKGIGEDLDELERVTAPAPRKPPPVPSRRP